MGNLIDTDGLDQYTDEITTFTSGDSSSPSSFTDIAVVASKEKPSSLFQKLSQTVRNIRVLRNQVNVTTNAATPVAASANANNSVAIGYASKSNGLQCVAVGYNANANSSSDIALGFGAQADKGFSVAVLYAKATSYGSIAIGALSNTGSTANYSMAIGYQSNTRANNAIALGYQSYSSGTNSTAIGQNANTSSDNTIQLGDPNISSLKCKVQLTTTSDIRDKTDIVPIPNAIDFLNEIEPITYVSNMRSLYEYDYKEEVQNEDGSTEIIDNNLYKDYGFTPYDKEEHAKGTKKGERRRSGVSAQNVRDAMVKIYGTDNYANLINDDMYDRENVPEEVESHLGVQYECFVPFLIKAVQELDARVKELEGQT